MRYFPCFVRAEFWQDQFPQTLGDSGGLRKQRDNTVRTYAEQNRRQDNSEGLRLMIQKTPHSSTRIRHKGEGVSIQSQEIKNRIGSKGARSEGFMNYHS